MTCARETTHQFVSRELAIFSYFSRLAARKAAIAPGNSCMSRGVEVRVDDRLVDPMFDASSHFV
jgi:hypothetical protein